MEFQNLSKSNAPYMDALVEAAARVVRSGRYINGPEVGAFEKALCRLTGAPCCVACSTGLDALRLILLAYMEMGRLREGDEVIVPANTFIATFLAVTQCGLTAVAADVDESTFCLDMHRLPLSGRTRAIIPVHLYGNPCWDADLFRSLHEKGILIIEDAAQAIGARAAQEGLHGLRAAGTLGDAAAISFYPAKNVGALGDAGAVLTADVRLADTVRRLANYGAEEKYRHVSRGLNCRMDEIQAAMLSVKLPHVDEITERRSATARLYDRLITNPEVKKPRIFTDGSRQVWHQYVIRHPRRDELRKYLADNDVGTEIHYPVACHLQPCYSGSRQLLTPSSLPVAERLAGEILSLPIADATPEEVEAVSNLINAFT